MEYFENIKRLRKEKGWTQQQLADNLQVSRKTITRWENGWNVPALFYAQKMAVLFSTTVGELMNGNPVETYDNGTEKTPHLKGLLVLYCVLTFLPVAVIEFGECVLNFIRELFRVEYGPHVMDGELFYKYIKQLEPLHKALFWVSAFVCLVLLAGWVAKLVHIFECTGDKYIRYLAYRKWSLGLVFLFACTYTALFDVYTHWWSHSYFLPLKLISGFFVGFWLLLIFDTVFRKVTRLLSKQNSSLKKLNFTFIVIGGAVIVSFIVLLIVGWHERYFVFTLFQLLCLLSTLAYLITGAVLLSIQYRRKTD